MVVGGGRGGLVGGLVGGAGGNGGRGAVLLGCTNISPDGGLGPNESLETQHLRPMEHKGPVPFSATASQ